MFCERCGKEVDDDSRFCQYCGAAVTPVAPRMLHAGASLWQWLSNALKDKKKIRVLWGALAAVIVVILAVILIAAMPRTVVLDDYITVRFEGLSTLGTAYLELDTEGFLAEFGREIETGEAAKDILERAEFKLELDNTTNLANGDKVYIDFFCDPEVLEEYDLRIRLKRDTRPVEGLREPEYLDLFAQLQLTYVGCAPYAEVRMSDGSGNAFIRDNVLYSIKDGTQISEGSTFTVEASCLDAAAHAAGYIILEKSREYTVAGLPQPQELNVFDQIEVAFSGIEGEGKAAYEFAEGMEFLKDLRFVFNKDSDLKEGDVVTLSYTNPYNLDPLKYGYTFSSATAKQYTVTKLGSYVTSFRQISGTEQEKLLKKVDALARFYLTKSSGENGTSSMLLENTGFANGNELFHAAGTSNVTLHSVIAGQTGSRYPTYYLVFVYTFDISAHPNITKNNGDVADACVYFYIKNPVLKGDGELDIDYEADTDILCKTSCYLNYGALEEAFLKSLTEQDVYTPSQT